jgi:hypothetical protein
MHDGAACYRVASAEIVSDVIDGETVLVDLANGSYYTANATGGVIWSLVVRGLSGDQAVAELARRFLGDEAAIRSGCAAFIARLCAEGLLLPAANGEQVHSSGAMADPPLPAGAPVAEPKLTKYTDMEDLLSLDPIHEVDEMGWPHVKPSGAR